MATSPCGWYWPERRFPPLSSLCTGCMRFATTRRRRRAGGVAPVANQDKRSGAAFARLVRLGFVLPLLGGALREDLLCLVRRHLLVSHELHGEVAQALGQRSELRRIHAQLRLRRLRVEQRAVGGLFRPEGLPPPRGHAPD